MIFKGFPPGLHTRALLERRDGATFLLGHNQYEHPQLWEIGLAWLPESHPRALDFLEDEVERTKLESWRPEVRREMEAYIERLSAVLCRNGR